jgi:acetyl esterase
MPLSPYLADRLPLLDGLSFSKLGDPELMARFIQFHADDLEWVPPAGVDIRDEIATVNDDRVPVRVYRPAGNPSAALLWAHGGGFVGGNLDMPEAHVVAAELAQRASAVVVSVGYRLASSDIQFPLPVNDVLTAWAWMRGQVRSGIPLGIGGASAGAALAMTAALRLVSESNHSADALLLAYPFVHFPTPALDQDMAAEMAALPALVRFNADAIAGMVQGYVGRLSNIPPEAMPGAASLTGLPATTIVLCEYDDLRPSGELLSRQLTESGVPNDTYLARGVLHGHLNRLPGLEEVDRSLDVLAQALLSRSS